MIAEFAAQPITPVTLEDLLGFEGESERCALYVHREIPIRLARRVRAIEQLPFIVGTNPHIASIYTMYKDSFHTLVETEQPKTKRSLEKFTAVLSALVDSHLAVIPTLARGFMEAGKYMTTERKHAFLDEMIRARIGIRVLAEHYLSLANGPRPGWIGVVNINTNPNPIITSVCQHVQHLSDLNYGIYPDFHYVGARDASFAYLTIHMEYIFMELIKNSMRATVENTIKKKWLDIPPIEICVGRSDDSVEFRIRDVGGGINLEHQSKIWEYSFTTVEKNEEDFLGSQTQMIQSTGGPIAGLGFGLPMSRVYARFFGGSLDIFNVAGHGCDVFLKFPNITSIPSKLEI